MKSKSLFKNEESIKQVEKKASNPINSANVRNFDNESSIYSSDPFSSAQFQVTSNLKLNLKGSNQIPEHNA